MFHYSRQGCESREPLTGFPEDAAEQQSKPSPRLACNRDQKSHLSGSHGHRLLRAAHLLSARHAWRLFSVLVALLGLTVLVSVYVYIHHLPLPATSEAEQHIRAPPSRAFCSKVRPPMVCAHGGDSTDAPPNTARSFQAAIDGSADCVEIDAALSRDGVLVALHVRELQQLLGRHEPGAQVGDFNWSELSSLRWASGEPIMAVEAVVRMTSPFVESVTLDVKTYQDASGLEADGDRIAESLVRLVHATGCANCLIWAKSDSVVQKINQISPGQRTGYIVMNETEAAVKASMHLPLRLQAPEVVGIHHAMVDTKMLHILHGGGKLMHTWTINSAKLMHKVLDVGVDALVTNYPRMAKEAIEARIAQCGGVVVTPGAIDEIDYGGL